MKMNVLHVGFVLLALVVILTIYSIYFYRSETPVHESTNPVNDIPADEHIAADSYNMPVAIDNTNVVIGSSSSSTSDSSSPLASESKPTPHVYGLEDAEREFNAALSNYNTLYANSSSTNGQMSDALADVIKTNKKLSTYKTLVYTQGQKNWKYTDDVNDTDCLANWDYKIGDDIVQSKIPNILKDKVSGYNWCATTQGIPLNAKLPASVEIAKEMWVKAKCTAAFPNVYTYDYNLLMSMDILTMSRYLVAGVQSKDPSHMCNTLTKDENTTSGQCEMYALTGQCNNPNISKECSRMCEIYKVVEDGKKSDGSGYEDCSNIKHSSLITDSVNMMQKCGATIRSTISNILPRTTLSSNNKYLVRVGNSYFVTMKNNSDITNQSEKVTLIKAGDRYVLNGVHRVLDVIGGKNSINNDTSALGAWYKIDKDLPDGTGTNQRFYYDNITKILRVGDPSSTRCLRLKDPNNATSDLVMGTCDGTSNDFKFNFQ